MAHMTLTDDEKTKPFAFEMGGATYLFNRSEAQCRFLLDLCDNDLWKYVQLETTIKKKMVSYCPSTKEEVELLLNDVLL